MKFIGRVAIACLCVSPNAEAIECGPILRPVVIEQMQKPLDANRANLQQHRQKLSDDINRLIRVARPGDDLSQIDRIQGELTDLDIAEQAASDLSQYLLNATMLADIRDQMRDAQDRLIVNKYLSLKLYTTRQVAASAHKVVLSALHRIARPSIAIDAAVTRDLIEGVMAKLASCSPPK